MSEYDYELLHKFFNNLYVFSDYLHDEDEDEEFEDSRGNDISACIELSICDEFKEIVKSGDFTWHENTHLLGYKEIKEGEKTVGAKGIVHSYMDYGSDPDDPHSYCEFAHIEKDGEVEEYVKEIHIDEIVVDKYSKLENYKTNTETEGCEESKDLIQRVIENSEDLRAPKEMKYRCLIEATKDDGSYFEIWKIGYTWGEEPHMLAIVGPELFQEVDVESILKLYLNEEPLILDEPYAMPEKEELAKLQMQIWEGESDWYNKGSIPLDPAQARKEEIEETLKQEIGEDPIYPPEHATKQDTLEVIAALETAHGPIAQEAAQNLIKRIKAGYEIATGEKID